jgi:sarcosine oxidase
VPAGPWLPGLLAQFAPKLVVRRQVLYWFETEPDAGYGANEFPIFIWLSSGVHLARGSGPDDVFYGFPQVDGDAGAHAIKIATEQCETSTTPEQVNRDVAPEEISTMFEQHIRGRLRGVDARCVKASTCLYTNAPSAGVCSTPRIARKT